MQLQKGKLVWEKHREEICGGTEAGDEAVGEVLTEERASKLGLRNKFKRQGCGMEKKACQAGVGGSVEAGVSLVHVSAARGPVTSRNDQNIWGTF